MAATLKPGVSKVEFGVGRLLCLLGRHVWWTQHSKKGSAVRYCLRCEVVA